MTAPMNDDQAGRAVALAEYFVMLRDDLVRVGIIAGNTPPMFMTEAVCGAIKRQVAAEREQVRAEVLRNLMEWHDEYMQQARGGDNTGHSDARADAAREIHDHIKSSWETRALMAHST